MDGACKKTLRLIQKDADMHQIFPQRCSTHGCNLLTADIGKCFTWEITMCVRLIKFICNHDAIFSLFSDIAGSLQLFAAVETRFASQIYSSERVLADKVFIRELFTGGKLRRHMEGASDVLQREFLDLDSEFNDLPNDMGKD